MTIERTLILTIFSFGTQLGMAQGVDMGSVNPGYMDVLKGRTAKFLEPMDLGEKYETIQSMVIEQYCNLSAIHDSLDVRKKKVKAMDITHAEKDEKIEVLEDQRDAALYIRHNAYLAQLLSELTYEQVDKIKDGMTYGVMSLTYSGFENMLLDLTDQQKKKIWMWLYEARERAMDQGSSDDKHKMFGKYKGRINNYLASEGYDLKKESKAWHERMRAEGKEF